MRYAPLILFTTLFVGIAGCAPLTSSDLSSFNPYITKDGQQSFRFVANNKLPSYYKDADIQQIHEAWISNEMGRRQYCTNGYNIESQTNSGEFIVYEGTCK